MKKIYLFAFAAMTALQVQAQRATQDTYVGAALATEDLNGTARYVGMGGAMDALGAEISTMGSNPAGIGLFRKNQVSASLSVVSQEDGKTFQNGSKTHVSFDQIGIVFSGRTGKTSYLNFGFNFHKNRNFNHVLYAEGALSRKLSNDEYEYFGAQNRQSVIKDGVGLFDTQAWSQLDDLYFGNLIYDDATKTVSDYAYNAYDFNRAVTGYIGEFDFNISGNIKNRLYLGLTVGIQNVNYKNYSEHYEFLYSDNNLRQDLRDVLISDNHKITGTGFNIKAGLIFRPVEESPFRIGLSVASPTFYRLTTENYTTIGGNVDRSSAKEDFRFNTPWKFGLSLGHTVGNYLALGAVYEYADYGACDMRTIDGSYYDPYYDTYSSSSSTDNNMKRHTEETLKGVHTVKLGAEFKVDKNIALRLGYNYVSPMYKEDGVRDQTIYSPGVYYASTTHYINWKATNRITAGVGFSFDKFRLDLAYQYNTRKGDFYPFMKDLAVTYVDEATGASEELRNHCDAVSVKDNRHQIQASLVYTF